MSIYVQVVRTPRRPHGTALIYVALRQHTPSPGPSLQVTGTRVDRDTERPVS